MILFPATLLLPIAVALMPAATCAAEGISFSRDIAPVLGARCAACHMTGQEEGNLALHPAAAYSNLVNVPSVQSGLLRVKPGAPRESYLLLKLQGEHLDAGGTGRRMPLDSTPLDEPTLQRIRSWITGGAAQ